MRKIIYVLFLVFFFLSCTKEKEIFQPEENNFNQLQSTSSTKIQDLDNKNLNDNTEIDKKIEKIEEISQKIDLRSNLQTKTIPIKECFSGGELRAFYDAGKIIKLTATCHKSTQKNIQNFYLSDDDMLVFTQDYFYDSNKVEKTQENKYYFSEKQMIRGIDGDKKQLETSEFSKIEKKLSEDLDLYFSKLK